MIQTNDISAAAPALTLTPRRKAALVVQMMISDGGSLSLTDLPEHLQELLAVEMTAIKLVDRETVNAVAEEFSSLLGAIGMSGPKQPGETIDAISDHVTPSLAKKLRTKFGLAAHADPWDRIKELEIDDLTAIVTRESPQVGAIILSKLPVEKAAALLSSMPGPQARGITIAMSDTSETQPETVLRIGKAILQDMGDDKITAFEKPPVDRLGAILNNSSTQTRETLLSGIEEEDEEFAQDVRKAIFTFAHIPARVQPTDVPNVLRLVDAEVLSTAIAAGLAAEGPDNETAEFILANVSQRMAASMREEAAEAGTIKPKAAEDAMNAIASAIKEQADAGNIEFVSDEVEEQE